MALAVLAMFFNCLPSYAEDAAPSSSSDFMKNLPDVVAQIGNKKVSADEFRQAVRVAEARRRMQQPNPDNPPPPLTDKERYQLLHMLVESKALRILANESKVKIPKATVDKVIQKEIDRLGGEDAYAAMLKRMGITKKQHRQMRREQLLERAFAQSQVGDVSVSDVELRQQYERLKKAGKLNAPERAQIRHILILARGDNEKAWDAAKKKIDAIRKRIVDKGEDFAKVAREVSEDPRTAKAGGEMRIGKGSSESEFEKKAFSLPIGQVSKPFKSKVGWHIMVVENRYPAGELSFEQVKDRLRSGLEAMKRGKAFHEFLLSKMKDMNVKIFVKPPSETPAPKSDLDSINSILDGAS